MERICIIKNFFDLVGLTKGERISLINALMKDWNLTPNDLLPTQETTSVGTDDDFFGEKKNPSSKPKCLPAAIVFNEKKTDPAEGQAEIPLETPPSLEETPKVKRRGRRPKAEVEIEAPDVKPTITPGRRGRPKKTENATATNENKTETKRGRPKKIKTVSAENDKTPPVLKNPEEEDTPPEVFSSRDEELIADTACVTNLEQLLEDEPPVRSRETKKRNPAFCYLADYPAVKKQAIGRDYPFEFLYQWEGHNLLSRYVLSGLMPIGIYVPYKSLVFGKYRGFIISIYDEQVIDNLDEAIDNAQKKMPAIDGEEWSVMNAVQFSVIKNSSDILNRMLGKIGGDRLRQTYRLLSPKSNHASGIGKFRYAIDVK